MAESKYIVVFDLDGTLCDVGHRMYHITAGTKKDWDSFNAACISDPVVDDIRELAVAMRRAGYTIAFITGRSDEFRDQTWSWLCNNGLGFGELYMRPAHNHAPDTVVKLNLAKDNLGLPNILFAVEDRDKVVAAWREAGVTCLQCRPGDY